MSVVNSMLRDLEARGGDLRQPKIPVRTENTSRRKGGLLIGVAVVAAAALAWQFLPLSREGSLPLPKPNHMRAAANAQPVVLPSDQAQSIAAQPLQSQVAAAQIPAVTPPAASATASKPLPATLHANWQWSNDGFALQLDTATDVRYGIERVDAGTLKISLAHNALAALAIPTPTPAWIDVTRVQHDAGQQTITVSASTRLEYDVAMVNDGALVISVWRDANSVANHSAAEKASATVAGEAVENGIARDAVDVSTSTAIPAKKMVAVPREYAKPRIDPSSLTPAQRDARQSAQAMTQLRTGQESQALSTLRTTLQSGDAAPKSAALFVTVLMSQQKMQEAQPYLERALQQTPNDAALLKLKARILAARGEIAGARDVLAGLVPATSADTELLAMTASLAQQAHDFVAAASYYLQWTRIEAANGAAWYGLALALDAQASSANAIAAYQHALTLINDARLRDYASARIAALRSGATESMKTGAAAAR